ncbi:MAG: M10 family metallopeptidase C-terminal domain-containing protein, partial [Cyanobacteria bacterium P01_G01_bin.4]
GDGGFGVDRMDGGSGIDTLDVRFWNGAYHLDMNTGVTNFAGETAVNFENVWTGNGNDRITGTAASNLIVTAGGNDRVDAGAGHDRVYTGSGNDTVDGGSGNDTINGGGGNDWIDGGFGLDRMDGGSGVDTLDVRFWNGDYELNMNTGVTNFAGETAVNFENVWTGNGDDEIIGTAGDNLIVTLGGNDTVKAGAGNDRVFGGSGNDSLDGEAGNDRLVGGSGNDIIRGGSGDDVLIGGAGKDTMYDGAGLDIYKYYRTSDSGVGLAQRDVIMDFTRGFDKIDLSSIDANTNILGDQAFNFIGTGNFTGSAGEVRYYTSGSNAYIQVDIHGDLNTTADMEIRLNGVNALGASDFIL